MARTYHIFLYSIIYSCTHNRALAFGELAERRLGLHQSKREKTNKQTERSCSYMTLRYLLDALLVMDQGSKQRAKDMPPILTILSFSFLILCLAWVHTPCYNFFLLQQRLGWRHWCKNYTRSRGAFKGKMQKTMDSWLDRRRAFGLGIGSLASFWWIMV